MSHIHTLLMSHTMQVNTLTLTLSDVQDVIKAKYGEIIPTPAVLIQLYDQQGQLIADLDDIAIEKTPQYYKKLAKGGSCVVIGVSPPPSRQPTQTDLGSVSAAASTSLLSTTEGSPS
ncbi:hypothetical protein BDEG_24995 [Batrachochytrium dendrobatidis JEL423]|uniref:PB1 domain-containing protein n=1 Tax=Batrachochytrium dendrobatidis (strain JEL423) TaxID=403673 RepID=A0A177WMQ3_BATDL|nr:hypothetical protein BDEG_24995 [Batrachochytrium dendrobatidis JEL423]